MDILLFDGAFGTYYRAIGGKSRKTERANIEDAAAVLRVHREYIEAGAGAVITNTFGANALNYDESELREIIKSGLSLAREAADGKAVTVFAGVGRIANEDPDLYAQEVKIFLEYGARDFIFETMSAFEPLLPALEILKDNKDVKDVFVTFAVSPEGYTAAGLNYKPLIAEAMAHEAVTAAGLNCVCGPAHMEKLTRRIINDVTKPLICRPNAGYAGEGGGFRDNPAYFAQKLADLVSAGAAIVGGCCGTAPAHISAFAKRERGELRVKSYELKENESKRKLHRKPILVEVDPPADGDASFILKAAAKLKSLNITAMTLADSPLGRSRADSLMTAALVKREAGLDVIPHITCRDKNRVAIKAALLGAAMFGIDKVLAVTGDPVSPIAVNGAVSEKKFEFNSMTLIDFITRLNGETLKTPITIGGALNVNAANFNGELGRAFKKAENGARFFLSQPIFSEEAARNFIAAKEAFAEKGIAADFYAGILPVAGYKNALFLNNEVSGISIPEPFVESLKDAGVDEVCVLSAAYAAKWVGAVYESADGFYIMTPLKKISIVERLIEECFE